MQDFHAEAKQVRYLNNKSWSGILDEVNGDIARTDKDFTPIWTWLYERIWLKNKNTSQ